MSRIVALFPGLSGVGGIQQAGRLTARALVEIAARRSWRTELLSLNDSSDGDLACDGELSIRFRGFARRKMSLIAAAVRASGEATVILAFHPNLGPLAAGLRFRRPRLRVITVCHGIEVWKPLPLVRRRSLRRANVILAPSRHTADKLSAIQSLPQHMLRVLPWPLDPCFLAVASAVDRLPLPPGFPPSPVILTAARWSAAERYKGLDDLIEAMSRLRESGSAAQLAVVGDGDDLPRLRALASERGVLDRIHFCGQISNEELAGAYAHSEIFVLPSTGEGFGLVFLEAMALGKPVIAANAGGATDIITDGMNGKLVEPRDPAALAAALAEMLSNEESRAGMGRRGAQIVRAKYSFERFRDSLEGILAECGMDET